VGFEPEYSWAYYIIREKPWFDYGIQKRFSTQKEAHGVKKVFGLKI
jgi:hypothetical protein